MKLAGADQVADHICMADGATAQVVEREEVALDERAPAEAASWERLPRGLGATFLAAALALGIAVGWGQATPRVWPWLAAAASVLMISALVRRRAARAGMILLCLAMAMAGAGWVGLRQHYTTPDDLAAYLGDEAALVRVRGVALGAPIVRGRSAGSLAQFDYREPATYFPMRIDALLGRDGAATPVRGKALVRVDESAPPFRAGDQIETIGFILRPAAPRNPGEFNYREYAKTLGQAGILTVASRDLLLMTPAERGTLWTKFIQWREALQRRAGAWLLADLPESDRPARDSLLVNLLLGQRDAEIDIHIEPFQRVGLAHILAISGFHLSVLAGFVLLLARLAFGHRPWHGWLIIAIVLVYLMLVEVRTPVLRAGVMTMAASLGLVFGRRLRVSGLVALSAIVLLLWRPDQLFNAGFQLTYGVVLGLIHLTPPVRARWFGRQNMEAATTAEMLGEWLKTSAVAAVVAWLVATPIAVYHFGAVSPLGAPLSIVAVPLSALLLAIGYLKIALGAVLPSAALLLGIPLSIGADLLLSIVNAIDKMPLSIVHVPHPTALWSIAAVVWVCWWSARGEVRRRNLPQWLAVVALIGWLIWPFMPLRSEPALRMDMLSVGDGSCYVVRSGGRTVVFDAGSSTDLNAGQRSIIPAMRRLGVRRIDAIAISHANLDHYSAVLEMAEEFRVGEVLLTRQFVAEAEADPIGPLAHVLGRLVAERVMISECGAGMVRSFGEARWTWIHPPSDSSFEKVNDCSMVIALEAAGRRVLLCGDIQREAMAILLGDQAKLKADILELPHHGSHHEAAEAFVKSVAPAVVMQSTGWMRWRHDKWATALAQVERLVTARDGACWIEIDQDCHITTGRFIAPGEAAGVQE